MLSLFHRTDKQPVDTQILQRWMLRRDIPRVLEIDRAAFNVPFSHASLRRYLREPTTVSMVAERNFRVVGYMLYTLGIDHIRLDRLAVSEYSRRSWVASSMLHRLVGKLSLDRRVAAETLVSEYNLPFQMCLKANGWRCIDTIHDHAALGHDAYIFRFDKRWSGTAAV